MCDDCFCFCLVGFGHGLHESNIHEQEMTAMLHKAKKMNYTKETKPQKHHNSIPKEQQREIAQRAARERTLTS